MMVEQFLGNPLSQVLGEVSIPAVELWRERREGFFFLFWLFLFYGAYIVFKGRPRTVLHHQRIVYHGTIRIGSSFGVTPLILVSSASFCSGGRKRIFKGLFSPFKSGEEIVSVQLCTFTNLNVVEIRIYSDWTFSESSRWNWFVWGFPPPWREHVIRHFIRLTELALVWNESRIQGLALPVLIELVIDLHEIKLDCLRVSYFCLEGNTSCQTIAGIKLIFW